MKRGKNYLDSIIQPVQIIAHTDDINTAYELLATFAQSKSGTMIVQDLEYLLLKNSCHYI